MYDAPLRVKNDKEVSPLSLLALNLGEQIKMSKDTFDTVVIQMRLALESNEDEDEDQKVREIKDGEEDEENTFVVQAFAVRGGTHSSKITLDTKDDPEVMNIELAKSKQYMEVVDFDDHFNDVALDWTNPDFDQ